MSSLCSSSFRVILPLWRHISNKNYRYWILPHSKRKSNFLHICPPIYSSFNHQDSTSLPKQPQPGYDPSEDLFGLAADMQPRKLISGASKTRSWFGPNGQYIRELPCPSCRGRGYTPCAGCGIERSRADCFQCNGKGMLTCQQCKGDCVIWEESIDEQPWEDARSTSPLKVKEDDDVDNLDIKLDVIRKTKRVYQSPPPEVNLKISRSLKSLNEKTGLFSKRMKIIHGDPMRHAQIVAAIKKAKGTDAARKHASESMKDYFSNPENRHKRSVAMKGVKFFCRNCGRQGHRINYCPELRESIDRRFTCRLCGQKGHNRRTCWKLIPDTSKRTTTRGSRRCSICKQIGHNCRTCSQQSLVTIPLVSAKSSKMKIYVCSFCQEEGHNIRTCPKRPK